MTRSHENTWSISWPMTKSHDINQWNSWPVTAGHELWYNWLKKIMALSLVGKHELGRFIGEKSKMWLMDWLIIKKYKRIKIFCWCSALFQIVNNDDVFWAVLPETVSACVEVSLRITWKCGLNMGGFPFHPPLREPCFHHNLPLVVCSNHGAAFAHGGDAS